MSDNKSMAFDDVELLEDEEISEETLLEFGCGVEDGEEDEEEEGSDA